MKPFKSGHARIAQLLNLNRNLTLNPFGPEIKITSKSKIKRGEI